MELVNKLEKLVLGWAKNVPHLPVVGQKWLGANVWWIVAIGAVLSGIAVLVSIAGIFTLIALLGAASSAYYVAGTTYTSLGLLGAVVSLVFVIVNGILLALAVKPLQRMEKKGWVLLFMTLLVQAVSVVVNAVLSFSVIGFIFAILFGSIGLAIGAYFLSEIHGQFGHTKKPAAKKV